MRKCIRTKRDQFCGAELRVLAFFIAFGVGFTSSVSGELFPGELSKGTVSLYSNGQMKPNVVVQIGSVKKTQQRRGFYRIGLLPGLRVQDVVVKITNPQAVHESLIKVDRHFRVLGDGSRVELRNLRIVVSGDTAIEVKADNLIMDAGGVWKIKGNVMIKSAKYSGTITSATLAVAGENVGQLLFQDDGGSHLINVLSAGQQSTISN